MGLTIQGSSGSSTPLPLAVFPDSGTYFTAPNLSNNSTVNTASLLTVFPIVLGRAVTVSEMVANVSVAGGASSTVRFGIYSDNGSQYPGALVVDTGTVATSGGTGRFSKTSMTTALSAGRIYWIGCVLDGGGGTVPTVNGMGPNPTGSYLFGNNAANAGFVFTGAANNGVIGYSQSSVSGALPSTFTASKTQVTVGGVILVALKAA